MALSFLGLNSQTGDERRVVVDDSVFSSRPGREPFFGKQPRTGSALGLKSVISVRQACPSWQATLPPAALGEERQVSDQVAGASRLTVNASTDAVVAGEQLILFPLHIVVTSFG